MTNSSPSGASPAQALSARKVPLADIKPGDPETKRHIDRIVAKGRPGTSPTFDSAI